MKLSEAGKKWLQGRGISETTYSRWPVVSASVPFRSGKAEAVVFNFTDGPDRVNWKARSIGEKDFSQQQGGKTRFWNLDRVLSGPRDVVYVTEGEMDALALSEAGFPENSILAFPGGAPVKSDDTPSEKKRYEHVLAALEAGLSAVKRFVLITDNDDPGRALRADLARLFGVGKCAYVELPEGVKDVNEALIAWGAEDLRIYITEGYKQWPVVGLYGLDDLPEPPDLELWKPGFAEWENKIHVAPSMMSVMTGYPGHGKTTFAQQFWFNVARRHGISVAMMSAETMPKPYVRRNLRQFYHGVKEGVMDSRKVREADDWIRNHILFMAHPNTRPTFPWLMDTLEAAVQREGVRAVVIDPWNKIEMDSDKPETVWIGECLDELLDAARGLNIHIQVLAHPAKPEAKYRREHPDLYSISGSANWFNRVDQGFSIHRPQIIDDAGMRQTEANFYHLKARFEDLGHPCKVSVKYNTNTGCFQSADYENIGSRAA